VEPRDRLPSHRTDAVVDGFTEFGVPSGGTDAKGYTVGGSLGARDNTWLSLNWASARLNSPVRRWPVTSIQSIEREVCDELRMPLSVGFSDHSRVSLVQLPRGVAAFEDDPPVADCA